MRFRWFGLALASTSFLMSLLLRVFWGELTPFLLKRGVSGSVIGLVGSVFFIGYVIAQLIGGVLADRLGTGFIMGIGLIISGFLNTLYGVLPLSTWVPSLWRWRLTRRLLLDGLPGAAHRSGSPTVARGSQPCGSWDPRVTSEGVGVRFLNLTGDIPLWIT
ncbi:MAG: MFS transporter [Vulcanisaeta sp.]